MGLQENLQKERVEKLNIREAIMVPPTATVREAVKQMRDRDLGCVMIVGEDKKLAGMFTESQLTEILSHGPAVMDAPISEYMAERCPRVRTTDPISDVLEGMQLKNVRMLCVVDENEHVVGLTGQRGLMEYVAEHFPGQVMVQRVGQTPYLHDKEGA